jgi:general secretion pathway protein I
VTVAGIQRGYTLIEVVAAFSLLALGLGVLLAILSGGVQQTRWSADTSQGVQHAQSVLDTLGVGVPLELGRTEGESDDGRYRWTLSIDEYVEPEDLSRAEGATEPAPTAGLLVNRLYRIELLMRWGAESPREQVVFRTLRLRQETLEAGE